MTRKFTPTIYFIICALEGLWVLSVFIRTSIAIAFPSAVVTINTNRKAGSPDGPAVYMADTIEFLNEAYVVIGEDYWMSPELAELCSFDPGRTPFIEDDESG